MTLSANLIEHYEHDQDLKLTKSQKRQQRRLHKKRPMPGLKRFANPNRHLSLIDRVLSDDFHEKLIAGKPGTFEDLIMFLRDQTKDRRTIGLKNHYLKFLKNYSLTNSQAIAVRQLIWDYANSNQVHRSRLYSRLAIRVSTPNFHLAISEAAKPGTRISAWKMHRLRAHLDHHCPETKPTTI